MRVEGEDGWLGASLTKLELVGEGISWDGASLTKLELVAESGVKDVRAVERSARGVRASCAAGVVMMVTEKTLLSMPTRELAKEDMLLVLEWASVTICTLVAVENVLKPVQDCQRRRLCGKEMSSLLLSEWSGPFLEGGRQSLYRSCWTKTIRDGEWHCTLANKEALWLALSIVSGCPRSKGLNVFVQTRLQVSEQRTHLFQQARRDSDRDERQATMGE